ncbi:MAG: ABC transporter substrate-binding protein [Cyanobacteriota bacterium]|jgi:branched-chain amino acid transport system substrate-binding protein
MAGLRVGPKARHLGLALLLAASIGGAVAITFWRQRPVLVVVDLQLVGGAAWDPTSRNTAELFLEERPGRRIRLVNLFNLPDPRQSPPAIAKLKREGVVFFISTHPSSHALASLGEFSKGDALAINASAASSALSGHDDYFLRVVPDVLHEQHAIAQAVHRLPGPRPGQLSRRRLLVLQDTANPAYGDTALVAFRAELERLGGWQLEVRRLRVSDFEPRRDRDLLRGDYDAAYILAGMFQPAIGNLSQLFHHTHPQAPILLTPWARSPAVIGNLGEARAQTLLASPFQARGRNPEVNRYFERFRRRFSYSPSTLSIGVRQALELLDQALESGASSPVEVKRFLLSRPQHRTSLGTVSFDANGDQNATFYIIPAEEDQGP